MQHTVVTNQQKVDAQAEALSKMEGECKTIEGKISQLNVRQAEIREISSELKTKNNELKDTLSSKRLQLEELLALKRQLECQIVSSPDKLKRQLADSQSSLVAEQQEIKLAEKKYKELNQWVECVEGAVRDIASAREGVDAFATELDRQKQIQSVLTAKEQQIMGHKEVLKGVQQNILQVNRRVLRMEEKIAHQKQQAEQRSLEATTRMNRLQTEILQATNLKSDVNTRAEAMENEVHTLRKLVEAEKSAQEQVRASVLQGKVCDGVGVLGDCGHQGIVSSHGASGGAASPDSAHSHCRRRVVLFASSSRRRNRFPNE